MARIWTCPEKRKIWSLASLKIWNHTVAIDRLLKRAWPGLCRMFQNFPGAALQQPNIVGEKSAVVWLALTGRMEVWHEETRRMDRPIRTIPTVRVACERSPGQKGHVTAFHPNAHEQMSKEKPSTSPSLQSSVKLASNAKALKASLEPPRNQEWRHVLPGARWLETMPLHSFFSHFKFHPVFFSLMFLISASFFISRPNWNPWGKKRAERRASDFVGFCTFCFSMCRSSFWHFS